MGFTWNGVFPDPFTTDPYINNNLPSCLFSYMRPADPILATNWATNVITANNYGDLVNTSCVRIYTDITLGSTEDTINNPEGEGLLSIVPVNASNLGVAFYQNNFNNELTKIPKIITEIGVRLANDQGFPFILPNSATVILEIAVSYY